MKELREKLETLLILVGGTVALVLLMLYIPKPEEPLVKIVGPTPEIVSLEVIEKSPEDFDLVELEVTVGEVIKTRETPVLSYEYSCYIIGGCKWRWINLHEYIFVEVKQDNTTGIAMFKDTNMILDLLDGSEVPDENQIVTLKGTVVVDAEYGYYIEYIP